MKGIENSDLDKVILGMKNPCIATIRDKAVVNEVNLNMLKWVKRFNRLKWRRS